MLFLTVAFFIILDTPFHFGLRLFSMISHEYN